MSGRKCHFVPGLFRERKVFARLHQRRVPRKHIVDAGDVLNPEALRNVRNALLRRRFNVAFLGGKLPENGRKEGRLPAAVRADEADPLARTRNEVGFGIENARPAHEREIE